jgi:redox-regulated HSP33 family molecular chaperone
MLRRGVVWAQSMVVRAYAESWDEFMNDLDKARINYSPAVINLFGECHALSKQLAATLKTLESKMPGDI